MGLDEALELLKKPRMGSVILAFKRAKYMPEVIHEGPHSKKKKEEKEHEGNPFINSYISGIMGHLGSG
jgi:hypothetical protein